MDPLTQLLVLANTLARIAEEVVKKTPADVAAEHARMHLELAKRAFELCDRLSRSDAVVMPPAAIVRTGSEDRTVPAGEGGSLAP